MQNCRDKVDRKRNSNNQHNNSLKYMWGNAGLVFRACAQLDAPGSRRQAVRQRPIQEGLHGALSQGEGIQLQVGGIRHRRTHMRTLKAEQVRIFFFTFLYLIIILCGKWVFNLKNYFFNRRTKPEDMRDARNVDYLENACFKTSELFLNFSLTILDNEEVYFFRWAWQEERKPQKYYSRSLHFF